jgi:alginate production protein
MISRLFLLLTFGCWIISAQAQTVAPVVTPASDGNTSSSPPAYRPDERRPEKPYTVNLFDQPIELGMGYEVNQDWRRNFDLNSTSERGRNVLDHELKLNARMHSSDSVTFFAQLKALADRRKELRDGSVRNQQSLERGQTWMLMNNVAGLPLSVQIGRIALIERRSWWWDDDLDAVRLNFSAGKWRLETGLAQEMLRKSSAESSIDPKAKDVTRWFGNGSYRWAPRHSVEAFWLINNDSSGAPASGALFAPDTEDASDANLRWLGLRANGEARYASGHRLGYRADTAWLSGRETRTRFNETPNGQLSADTSIERNVSGHAWDIGAYWRLPDLLTFSLGLANGSGGSSNDSADNNFRQTGLQENKSRVTGVKRLRYYGELLDPQLANLRIATIGVGMRFFDNSSVELLQHRYRQQVASTQLAGSRLSEDPEGTNRDIGREIDLFFAMREWRHAEVTLLFARFRPGAAFAANRRDFAHAIELGAAFNF